MPWDLNKDTCRFVVYDVFDDSDKYHYTTYNTFALRSDADAHAYMLNGSEYCKDSGMEFKVNERLIY